MAKMAEMKEKGEMVGGVGVSEASRRVGEMWRQMSKEERTVWNEKAADDKARYLAEKAVYKGPWKVKKVKDSRRPKRAMSAFIHYSQEMRPKIKKENPELKTTEITKILGAKWRAASEEDKRSHVEYEKRERETYYKELAVWKEIVEKEEKEEEERRSTLMSEAMKQGVIPEFPPERPGVPQPVFALPNASLEQYIEAGRWGLPTNPDTAAQASARENEKEDKDGKEDEEQQQHLSDQPIVGNGTYMYPPQVGQYAQYPSYPYFMPNPQYYVPPPFMHGGQGNDGEKRGKE